MGVAVTEFDIALFDRHNRTGGRRPPENRQRQGHRSRCRLPTMRPTACVTIDNTPSPADPFAEVTLSERNFVATNADPRSAGAQAFPRLGPRVGSAHQLRQSLSALWRCSRHLAHAFSGWPSLALGRGWLFSVQRRYPSLGNFCSTPSTQPARTVWRSAWRRITNSRYSRLRLYAGVGPID